MNIRGSSAFAPSALPQSRHCSLPSVSLHLITMQTTVAPASAVYCSPPSSTWLIILSFISSEGTGAKPATLLLTSVNRNKTKADIVVTLLKR
ncbi:hypothetical protein YC2023_082358 [Brassica napus]